MVKLAIIGSRGIPANYGGFETFAEEISPLLVKNGIEVTVQCDNDSYSKTNFRGVNLFFSTVTKSKHPLKYYFEGINWACKNSDIVLVTTTMGSVFYFLNIFRNKIIITNPDGLDYKRAKWSFPKRMYIRLSELLAIRFSKYIIADSTAIKDYLSSKYSFAGHKTSVIEYGAYANEHFDQRILDKFSLSHKGYYLVVCRLEPENKLHIILEGYEKAETAYPIVIVGNITATKYVKKLYQKYNSERVRFIGGIYDSEMLRALRYSCKAYIHGHSVGGTNPSLLEAMASKNLILCHDNKFNREVTDNSQFYFGEAVECCNSINYIESLSGVDIERYGNLAFTRVSDYYNWDLILDKYLKLLKEINSP